MLRVYCADTAGIDLDADSPLSDYRRERLSRLKKEAQKRESLGVELLLDLAVKETFPDISLPLDIVCGENGKPADASGSFFFSLSHSDGHVLCAVSDTEVGADIQRQVKCRETLVKRFFMPDEQEYIFSSREADSAFTEIWCKKESFVKALGTGLTVSGSSYSVMTAKDIFCVRLGDFHIAVCCPGHSLRDIEIKKISLI